MNNSWKRISSALAAEDPYEFVELLRGEDMLAAQRNRSMREVARLLSTNPPARNVVEQALETTDPAFALDPFLNDAMAELSGGRAFLDAFNEMRKSYLDIAFDGVRLANRPAALLRTVLELCSRVSGDFVSEKISAGELEKRLLDEVGAEREAEAREVLRLGRLSWRLRDDDNILVARLESQLLRALDLAMERLKANGRVDAEAASRTEYLELVCSALRDPTGGPVSARRWSGRDRRRSPRYCHRGRARIGPGASWLGPVFLNLHGRGGSEHLGLPKLRDAPIRKAIQMAETRHPIQTIRQFTVLTDWFCALPSEFRQSGSPICARNSHVATLRVAQSPF